VRRFATVIFAGVTVVATVAVAGCGSASRTAAALETSPAAVASQALDVPAGYTASADQLAFSGPEKGWLTIALAPNGKLPERTAVLSTLDGGATWSQRWEGVGSPGQLVAVGPGHAFLTVDSDVCTISFGYCQARLLSLASARGGPAHLVGKRSYAVTSMAWAGPRTGVESVASAGCQDLWTSPSQNLSSCRSFLQLTTDGGAVFHPVLHTRALVLAVAGQSPSRWWAVTDTWLHQGGPKDQLFRSRLGVLASDGGRRWQSVGALPLAPYSPAIGPRTNASLVAHDSTLLLSYADLDSCAMHGCGDVATWESTDGGRQWAQLPYSRVGPPGCGPTLENPAAFSPTGVLYQATGVPLAACSPPGSWLSSWGSKRWARVASWLGGGLSSVSWPAKATGYVVVNGAVARTSDTGHSWVQVWPALAPTGPLAPLSATMALAAGDAVDPGVVMRSDDGGRRWSAVGHLPGDVTSMARAGGERADAAVLDVARDTWTLYTTSDGGMKWARTGALPNTASKIAGYSGIVELWARGEDRALVLTATGAGVYGLEGIAPAVLWATYDGGARWYRLAEVPLGQFGTTGPAAFVWEHGQWRGVVSDGTGAESTSDGGKHWAALAGASGFGGGDALPGGFVATWAGTGNGATQQLHVSSDSGRSWRNATLPSGQAILPIGAQRMLAFVSARDGWWDNGTAVFTTNDGGVHWSKPATGA
jgi:photosystem II stability/assembly factor-like uncharacterized protein